MTESTFAANEYNFVANYFAAEIKEFKSRQVKKKFKTQPWAGIVHEVSKLGAVFS